ncbi:MAG: chromosomal replication initiator protein DnaA, partial [Flavobacteriales bacterium]|nr:chromosomal replication initiator protein DnaA [Flavobacteriales bacterium]
MSKSHEGAWESCLKVIKDNVPIAAYKTWFDPIVPVKLENGVLTIQVPSHFFYEWLEEHYITLLRKVVKKELGSEGSLEYSIVMENNAKSTSPYTVKIPAHNTNSLRNEPVSMPINVNEKQIR